MNGTGTDTTKTEGQEVPVQVEGSVLLPHMSYDDPPGGMTADQYKAALWHGVKMFGDLDIFTVMLLQSLGTDLIEEHGVEAEMAIAAVEGFAKKVYAEATAAPAA